MDYMYTPHIPLWMQMLIALFALGVAAVTYVVHSLLLSFLFRKMGLPMWKAWVPVYSGWVFLEAANLPGAWALLSLGSVVPMVGWLFAIALTVILAVGAYRVASAFTRDAALYTALFVFFPAIYSGILGLGSATFDSSKLPERQEQVL